MAYSKKKKRKAHDKKRRVMSEFPRTCTYCLAYKKCKWQPKNKLRWYQEWCTRFDPDYKKIDRTRENMAIAKFGGRHRVRDTERMTINRLANELGVRADDDVMVVEEALNNI